MGWSLIAHTIFPAAYGTSVPNGGNSPTFDSTGGDLIVVAMNIYPGLGGSPTSVTDNKGNIYTQRAARAGAGGSPSNSKGYLYDSEGTSLGFSVGAGHFVTVSGVSFYPSFEVMVFKGSYLGGGSFDVVNTNGGYGVNSLNGASVTPTYPSSLVVSGLSFPDRPGVLPASINSGFTITDSIAWSGGNHVASSAAYLFNQTAAVDPTWTWQNDTPLHDSILINSVYRPAPIILRPFPPRAQRAAYLRQ